MQNQNAWFLCGLLVSSALAQGDSLLRAYKLQADFSHYEQGHVSVVMEATITNQGRRAVSELWLMLYPNRFKQELPNLDDVNYRFIYPYGFSKGEIEIESLTGEEGPLTLESHSEPSLPLDTLARLKLSRILAPGETTRFVVNYKLLVPRKFASFGRYKDLLTLSGAWFPYVLSYEEPNGFSPNSLPPLANWDIVIRAPSPVLLNGEYIPGSAQELQRKFFDTRQISVFLGQHLSVTHLAGQSHFVQLIFSDRNPREVARPLSELVIRWLEFVERHPELPARPQMLTLAQIPLRDSLISKGEGVTYFSDRAFKILASLQQYHTVPLLRALFYQLLVPQCSRRENSQDYDWVADAVSWHWTEVFMRENVYHHRDARTLGPLRTFSFLPAVDQVIYTPQFAFVDVFYDFVYPLDPIRDHWLYFNHQRPYGRTVLAHLEDEVGKELSDKIADLYVKQKPFPFVFLAQQVSGKPLLEKFEQWISKRPPVNYALSKHRQTRNEGVLAHEVLVKKESPLTFVEPVELGVTSKGNEHLLLRWDGKGQEHTYRFRTEKNLSVIEIDPRGRLQETKLSDNRRPPKYKLVLTEFIVDYDFNANRPQGFVATQFRKAYGGSNRYNFLASYASESYGVSLGYTRLFGRFLDRLRLSHALGVGFDFGRADDDWALGYDSLQSHATAVPISSAGYRTTVSAAYSFGNQISFTNPLQGGGAGVSASWGSTHFGGDFNYYRLTVGGSWVIPLHPNHLLAVRGIFGLSGPDTIPTFAQYVLGGINGIRGLSFVEDTFRGRNILLTSAEYRHFLWQDVDWNLWLFRVRHLQGALFMDAGRVTDTVQERANHIAFAVQDRTSRKDLWDVTSFSTDVGYGIRFLVDYLGVNPGILRLDAAKSLSEPDEVVRFYFGVTQSF